MKNKRILITGGAGFIGSHLVDSLLDQGWEITVLDNFTMGNKICPHALPKIRMIEADVRDWDEVCRATYHCDAIIHLAAVVGVDQVIQRKTDTIEIETIGTRNVVEAARHHQVQKIIYASSSAVYGSVEGQASQETDETVPISAYAIAKRLNELYLNALTLDTEISTNSLRFFNIYGNRQDSRMVIPRFFEQAMENQPIEVFGNGQQTRDFTHVSDVVKAITLLLGKKSTHGIFNISRGVETNIFHLAKLVKEIANSSSSIQLLDFPQKRNAFKVNRRVGCPSKLWKTLETKPDVLLQDGLDKYFRKLSQPLRERV